MERSADPLDRASEVTEEHNQECVDAARRAARPEQVRGEDGEWQTTECSCGEPIEPARLELGKLLCYDCQVEKERRGRVYGKP